MLKNKKKFFLKIIISIVILIFVFFFDVSYTERFKTRNSDGTQTLLTRKKSRKIFNPDGEYKISLNDESFYVYVSPGLKNKKNKKTLVILPEYTYFDYKNKEKKYVPHRDFEKLINEFGGEYRIVVVEYYGYNKSDDTKRKRSAEEICFEIHTALHLLGINKYILVPHGISGLYAIRYIKKYPNEVKGMIGIDAIFPYYFLKIYDSNEDFLKRKVKKEVKKIPGSYKNMQTYFWKTSKALEKFKFTKEFPVILFFSTQFINEMDNLIKNKILKARFDDYFKSVLKNDNTQKMYVLTGNHYFNNSQYKAMYKLIKQNYLLF